MAVFRHELGQLSRSALIWLIGLNGTLLLLIPIMFLALSGGGEEVQALMNVESSKRFFEALQLSPTMLETSDGVYAYISTFMNVALATAGGVFGLAVMTREHRSGALDFLYTKGHSRSAIFGAKLLAAMLIVGLLGLAYVIAALSGMYAFAGTQFSFQRIAWMAGSGVWLAYLYLFFAILLAALVPTIESAGLVALGVAFLTFVIGSIGAMAEETALLLFCPFHYVDAMTILRDGMPDLLMLLRIVVLSLSFGLAAWLLWRRRAFTGRG